MKRAISFILGVFLLAGCQGSSGNSSGGSGGGPTPFGGPNSAAFQGTPANFNGEYEGSGQISSKAGTKNANFVVQVDKTPTGLDFQYVATMEDGNSVQGSLTNHRVEGNTVFDNRDQADVGRIGAQGFYLQRPGSGKLEALSSDGIHLTIDAVVNEGSAFEQRYHADLVKK